MSDSMERSTSSNTQFIYPIPFSKLKRKEREVYTKRSFSNMKRKFRQKIKDMVSEASLLTTFI